MATDNKQLGLFQDKELVTARKLNTVFGDIALALEDTTNVQSDWSQTDNTADDYIKNKPAIPTKTSDLTNDSEFITVNDIPTVPDVEVYNGAEEAGKYISELNVDAANKHKVNVVKKTLPVVPSKTSELENDSGFITEEDLPVPYDDSELWNEIDDINDNKIPGLIKNFQLLSNGVFRVTKYDNTYFDIDTKLEKIVTNFTYNATTKNLELSLDDSTVLTIPMSAFIDDYSGSEGTQFVVNVSSENVISVTMKDGTVTYNQLAQAVKDKLDSIENKVDLFWCTYETTTYADITTAINNGKLPVVKYLDRIYRLTCAEGNFQIDLTHHHFEAVIGEISYYVRVSNLNTWHANAYTLAKSSDISDVPTKVSELENDSGFINISETENIINNAILGLLGGSY